MSYLLSLPLILYTFEISCSLRMMEDILSEKYNWGACWKLFLLVMVNKTSHAFKN